MLGQCKHYPLFICDLQKQKLREDSEMNSEPAVNQKLPRLIRNFPQTQPVANSAVENKQRLSKNTLAGVSDNLSYDLPIFCQLIRFYTFDHVNVKIFLKG